MFFCLLFTNKIAQIHLLEPIIHTAATHTASTWKIFNKEFDITKVTKFFA